LAGNVFPLKSQGKSSLRLRKSHACERIVLRFGSEQVVFCLVASKTTEKGHRQLNCIGLHSRNLEDFFRMPEGIHMDWWRSRENSVLSSQD